MFGRVAAWGFAAFLVVVPARIGVETAFADATVSAACACAHDVADPAEIQNQSAERQGIKRRSRPSLKMTIVQVDIAPSDNNRRRTKHRRERSWHRSIRPNRPLPSPRAGGAVRSCRRPRCRRRGSDEMERRRGRYPRRKRNSGALPRQQRTLPGGGAKLPRHRRARPRAYRPRPHRRDQPRDQSGDPADERSRAVGRARPLERAARNIRHRPRRLRGLRHRQICRADGSRRRRGGREARHCAQHRGRRGSRRRRRSARRQLDHARQSLADAGRRPTRCPTSFRCSCSIATACGNSPANAHRAARSRRPPRSVSKPMQLGYFDSAS